MDLYPLRNFRCILTLSLQFGHTLLNPRCFELPSVKCLQQAVTQSALSKVYSVVTDFCHHVILDWGHGTTKVMERQREISVQ